MLMSPYLVVLIIPIIVDRYHPDKNASNPEASELFKEVAYSYSILSDPEKRRQYDTAGFEVLFDLCWIYHTVLQLFFILCNASAFSHISDLSYQICEMLDPLFLLLF